MKKLLIFLLLAIIAFLSFMHNIGGLKVRTRKPEEGKKMEITTIVLEWNKLSEWWQEKRKNVFRQREKGK